MASYFMMCGFSSLSYSFEMTGYKKLTWYISALVERSLSVRGVADSNSNMVLWILSVQKHEKPLTIHYWVQINDSFWRVFGLNSNKVSTHSKLTPFIVAFKYCTSLGKENFCPTQNGTNILTWVPGYEFMWSHTKIPSLHFYIHPKLVDSRAYTLFYGWLLSDIIRILQQI